MIQFKIFPTQREQNKNKMGTVSREETWAAQSPGFMPVRDAVMALSTVPSAPWGGVRRKNVWVTKDRLKTARDR